MRGAAMVRIPNQKIQSARPCRPASLLIVHGDTRSASRPPWTLAVLAFEISVSQSRPPIASHKKFGRDAEASRPGVVSGLRN